MEARSSLARAAEWLHARSTGDVYTKVKLLLRYEWLGEPTQRIGPDIYVNKIVAELRFEHKGVVFFKDEQLQYVDLPESFVYPL